MPTEQKLSWHFNTTNIVPLSLLYIQQLKNQQNSIKQKSPVNRALNFVGDEGFEPPTPWV